MKRLTGNKLFLNKLIASLMLVGIVTLVICLSWLASPDPILDVLYRSIPIILMIGSLVVITVTGASKGSRIALAIVYFALSGIFSFMMSLVFWGIGCLFFGLIVLFDLLISFQGCQSPMVMNATDTFVTFIVLFFAAFAVGFFFEWINENIYTIWNISSVLSFYPIIDILGVNLLVVFTWSIVGIFLFEALTFAYVVNRKIHHGKEYACRFDRF